MPDARPRRIALNEAQFREINEDLRGALDRLSRVPDRLAFVCECGHVTCRDTIQLTTAAYEAVRANPLHFVVVPGHELLDVERVVERHDDYFVVEKLQEAAALAQASDPRRIAEPEPRDLD